MRCALMLCVIALSGCQRYYAVQDASTGRVYYTDRWVAADGYRGPLTIRNEQGERVRLREARVARISQDDFLNATAAETPDPQ